MSSKRFLVTGGCGFIGSHLVDYLSKNGDIITVIDDLSSGKTSNLPNSANLDKLILKDVIDTDFTSLEHFDGVFHLAAQASVPLSINNLYESSSNNLLSSLKIIELCAETSTPLVYASSSAVYGNLDIDDDDNLVDLISPYSADKRMLEIYCDMAFKLYNLRSFGLRFFNVYGPRQDPTNPYSGVISIFADKILKGEAITINGGAQTRDFIYVGDVVRGIWESYLYLKKESVAAFSNLLTGTSTSIEGLADKLILMTGNQVDKIYKKLQPGDPQKSTGTVKKMEEILKLGDFVQLEDGLSDVLKWMKTTDD